MKGTVPLPLGPASSVTTVRRYPYRTRRVVSGQGIPRACLRPLERLLAHLTGSIPDNHTTYVVEYGNEGTALYFSDSTCYYGGLDDVVEGDSPLYDSPEVYSWQVVE